jgi:hypothetical protein
MFFLPSCEKNEFRKTYVSGTNEFPILPRGDCDDCPDEDECCCTISLDNGDNFASLGLCGTSDGNVVTSCPSLPCVASQYALKDHSFTLSTPFNFKYDFCAFENSEFFIRNVHPTDVANVNITCQRGQSTPQNISLQLQANGGRAYITTNGSCEVNECQP